MRVPFYQGALAMHVLLASNCRLPAIRYGGTERVLWALGEALHRLGHQVSFLVAHGSRIPFGKVHFLNPERPLAEQIPPGVDIVHAHEPVRTELPVPFLVTIHSNIRNGPLDRDTVFISRNHASRYGAHCYVHHGLALGEYGRPDMRKKREYFHFLGKAAWKVKNVRGAIKVARRGRERLHVLGGSRINLKMGFRLTLDPQVRFHGMVGGEKKNVLLNGSKGLVFPVRWHEPFGLAVIESLYFGCPVFATPYGSLPELVTSDVGVLSNKADTLAAALKSAEFDPRRCHEYVCDLFTADRMARDYIALYEQRLNDHPLNPEIPRIPEPAIRCLPFHD